MVINHDGNAQNEPPTLKDPKFWTAKEKKTQKIDRLARSLLIQGLSNDIYSLIDSNETAKDLRDALERQMRGFEYGEQDRKATILYEYETFKAIEGDVQELIDLLLWIFVRDKMSRDVITVGSTIRIPLLYRGEYSHWCERFMNYLEEQMDGEAMINSIQNGDQPLPIIAQVSLAGNAQNAPPTLKDPKFWTAKEKKTRKIDHLWDALERQTRGSEYGEQDRKSAILQTKNLMDINIDALYNILKQNQGDVNDALGYKKKAVVVTSDPLALVAEKTNVSKRKKKVVASLDSEGSGADDFCELNKITALLAKAFNRRKFYPKLTNNNLRTSSTSQSANKKQEFVKTDDKKVEKKDDEKKRVMRKVKCYNCKKEGHFAKDCKKAKAKDCKKAKVKDVASQER
nr:nucleolar protein 58-like [Tanacetum cinerariifolium]